MGRIADILQKYQKMRDVDEEDRELILSLKEKKLVKIGINIKREKLVARSILDGKDPVEVENMI
jgi:hypothetical protein